MPYLCHADGRDIIDRAERWHRLASSAIPGLELEDVVARFYAAWTKVKFADGEGPLAQAMARALRRTPPQLPPGYQCEGLIHLAGLCRELQREAGDKPFYLSWRAAAAVLGLGKNSRQAGRWFFVLQAKGILQEHEKGSLESGKASEYRYLLPL